MNKTFYCMCEIPCADVDGENGALKGESVVYKPGYYYRKDRKEKVSDSAGHSKVNALVKPKSESDINIERLALDKPYIDMYCQDGKAPAKPMEGGKDDGKRTGKGREKETMERI